MTDNEALEVASKMFAALLFEPEEKIAIAETATLAEQMGYLKKYINTVPVSDRFDVGRVLTLNNRGDRIVNCSEGVVIDLDSLPHHIINQMYMMLRMKIEKLACK
jgi:hypothetical protein